MRKTTISALLASFASFCASCSREEGTPPAALSPKQAAESKLYQSFDIGNLKGKYSPRFERVAGEGGRSNVKITPPDHQFKDFSLKGKISGEQLKQLLSDLRTDLLDLAKAGGVEVVQKPRDMVPDRLNGLPYALFNGEYAGILQGFYFTYRQGTVTGAVDVIAGCTAGDREREWMLVCSVHEASP